MRFVTIAMTMAFLAATTLVATSIGSMGAAEAKAHVTKGSPGKCGFGKYYSKKDRGCLSKM